MLMILEADGVQRLALWQTRLIMNEWTCPEALRIELGGLNLDQAWARIVTAIAGVQMDAHTPRDKQLAQAAQREKLEKEIARLEKLSRAERQPKRKMEPAERIKALKMVLEDKQP